MTTPQTCPLVIVGNSQNCTRLCERRSTFVAPLHGNPAGERLAPSAAATPIDPLHGISVRVSDKCQCGSCDAVIGEGKGPRRAALFCCRCERPRGWMANEAHSFIAKVVKKFGEPTKPIKIRRNNSEGEQR